jgi:hypothetical protein
MIQPLNPPLELYELHVSVIVVDIDPNTKMEYVTMRMSKERYITPVSCSKQRICGSRWISMYAFSLERDPDFTVRGGSTSFNGFSVVLIHSG